MICERTGNEAMMEGYFDRLRVVVYVVGVSLLAWLSKWYN